MTEKPKKKNRDWIGYLIITIIFIVAVVFIQINRASSDREIEALRNELYMSIYKNGWLHGAKAAFDSDTSQTVYWNDVMNLGTSQFSTRQFRSS